MNKKELIKRLGEISNTGLEYINDADIKKAYEKIPKWYA